MWQGRKYRSAYGGKAHDSFYRPDFYSVGISSSAITDTIINYAAIDGENGVTWTLSRNNTLIADSSFTTIVSSGDTVFIQIDY